MIFLILAFMAGPYAEHAFLLEAMRKLYKVKTEDVNLFENPHSDKFLKK